MAIPNVPQGVTLDTLARIVQQLCDEIRRVEDRTKPNAEGWAGGQTNVTTDRTYNANGTTTDELADVLGTLIADLLAMGLLR